ncbi:TPA: hypothetical protein ACJIWZ_002743 [Enterobacter kobei]
MADPITAADVQAYLGELGYSIPGALLEPILCVVNKIIPCLDGAGYDECTAKLILMYAAALMATSAGLATSWRIRTWRRGGWRHNRAWFGTGRRADYFAEWRQERHGCAERRS